MTRMGRYARRSDRCPRHSGDRLQDQPEGVSTARAFEAGRAHTLILARSSDMINPDGVP